jgi:NAD(P)-dependent dehydrogenase (short-subunit alcohol dehydrogenase family)
MVVASKSVTPRAFLVTGANRGIGLAFARQLSERGDEVIATAR